MSTLIAYVSKWFLPNSRPGAEQESGWRIGGEDRCINFGPIDDRRTDQWPCIPATVASVTPGGPAEKAGLTAGDIIVDLGGATIRTTTDLSMALADLQPGTVVNITALTSAGAQETVTATVMEIPTG
jgi:S1-C subfamily serine protease